MKKLLLIVSVAFALFSSCLLNRQITGSGNIISTDYPISTGCTSLVNESVADIILIEDDINYVTVSGDDNVVAEVDVYTNGTTLYIETTSDVSFSSYSLIIYVPVQDINSIVMGGVGNLSADHTLEYTSFSLRNSGTGDIDLDVNTDEFICRLDGTGDISLSGSAADFDAELDGVGDIDAEDLVCADCHALLGGVGNIYVSVTDSLNAILSGVGSLFYWGDGSVAVTRQGTGVGDIHEM